MPGRGPGSRAGQPCRDHLGQEFKSKAEMCRHWNIPQVTLASRLKRGLDLKTALETPIASGPGTPCRDHLGTEYPSASDMFRAWGTNYVTYHYRREHMGWDMKKALETPAGDTDLAGAHACRDHMGNEFPSKKAMCEYWHVPRNVFFIRKKAGKSLAECLAPVAPAKSRRAEPVKDHTGHAFQSLDEMCGHYGILKSEYIQNIRNGLDLKRALTERTARPKRPKDHTGQEFESINAMCRAWGIDKTVLRSRLELGWTLEQILTHPENNSHDIKCTDHLGNKFKCQKDMLAFWNVSYATYTHRLKKGFGLEQALQPDSMHTQPCADHLGNAFPCLQAMLDYWFCNAGTYHHRQDQLNWDIEQCLGPTCTLPVFKSGPEVLDKLPGGWYLVKYRHHRAVVNLENLYTIAREQALLASIKSQDMPENTGLRHVRAGWFRVWGTEHAGPSPGVVMNPDRAWYEWCVTRYIARTGKTRSKNRAKNT